MKFQWDPNKAAINLRKHGIGFEEALTVFQDPLALIFDDEEHSRDEHREIIIGFSTFSKLLLVCFVERQENVIRIISARQVTRLEKQDYEEHLRSQKK